MTLNLPSNGRSGNAGLGGGPGPHSRHQTGDLATLVAGLVVPVLTYSSRAVAPINPPACNQGAPWPAAAIALDGRPTPSIAMLRQ